MPKGSLFLLDSSLLLYPCKEYKYSKWWKKLLERHCTKIIINNKDRPRTTTVERTFPPCWLSSLILLSSFGMCSLFLILCGQGAANLSIARWCIFTCTVSRWMVHLNVSSVCPLLCCEQLWRGHWIRVTKKKIINIYNYFSYSLPTPFLTAPSLIVSPTPTAVLPHCSIVVEVTRAVEAPPP